MKNFSSIVAPLTECLKNGSEFWWSENAQKFFELIKEQLCTVPVLDNTFEIECDVSGDVLLQERRPGTYFSEKFNGA